MEQPDLSSPHFHVSKAPGHHREEGRKLLMLSPLSTPEDEGTKMEEQQRSLNHAGEGQSLIFLSHLRY